MRAIGGFTAALSGDCDAYASTYLSELEAGGALASTVPDTPEGFAMGLVLNQRAVNDLFQRLGDTELPELSQGIPVPVLGDVTLAVQPSLPTLGIGGDASCVDCFRADVPFSISVGLGGAPAQVASGLLGAQMPLGMRPAADRRRPRRELPVDAGHPPRCRPREPGPSNAIVDQIAGSEALPRATRDRSRTRRSPPRHLGAATERSCSPDAAPCLPESETIGLHAVNPCSRPPLRAGAARRAGSTAGGRRSRRDSIRGSSSP